jgi:polyhydroxyalkanoate synthesis regulator phasin
MLDALKKTLYAGIGLAFLTRDKIEEMAKKMAEEAKLSEGEGKKLFEEFLRKSEEARATMEKMVTGAVATALEKLDIPRRGDIKALEARVAALEAKQHAHKG